MADANGQASETVDDPATRPDGVGVWELDGRQYRLEVWEMWRWAAMKAEGKAADAKPLGGVCMARIALLG